MAETDLKALLEAVARGDEAAFGLLYEATSPKLYGVAVRILKRSDLAEEAVQDAYLRIWGGADGYRPVFGAPLTWMATIARNRAIDLLRKRGEERLDENAGDRIADETVPDPFRQAAVSGELKALLACMEKLDGESRNCLLMAYYYGYTHEEIAARLAKPVGTVKSRIRRGLMRVKECLSDG